MELRSAPAGSMSPSTDPAALRVITTAVLVGLVASGVALATGLGLLAGGDRPPPGPKVVPAVDVFMVQHAITTGQVPAQPSGVPSPATSAKVP